ncbi:hypothetical protein [Henriciella aquimarina]|uniref:hypothetical protein n=1 Tax=Henriciella aquimarina TaxID=545261 RepID=UPI000A048AB1|nr:hypothetical protein [Henriciella aquimarina]
MAHDVMIASAIADKTKAQLVAKRLRALKFKVRYDARREHMTPTTRDLNDANRATTVLVLWSKAACNAGTPDSDWVHVIAHQGRSRRGALMQATLDNTVPDEPFDRDDRFKFTGMGPKRIPNGFLEMVEALAKKHKRKDLGEWLKIDPKDKDAQAAWKKAHPKDPISLAGKKKPADTPKTAAKATPAPKPEGKPAAEPESPAKAPPPAPEKPAAEEARPVPPAQAAAAATAGMAARSAPASQPARPAQTQFPYRRPHPSTLHDDSDEIEVGWKILGPIIAGCVLMLFFAWLGRSEQISEPSMPAIGNARPVYTQTCPPGQVPRSLIESRPLRTGPIVDDTEEPSQEGEGG